MSFFGEDGSPAESGLWNRKGARAYADVPRILIACADTNVGESIVLLLGLKGYPCRLATNEISVFTVFGQWRPQAVFLDTRIGGGVSSDFARKVNRSINSETVLSIAMSSRLPEESETEIRNAGYDGYLRRPCPIWQMADMLNNFFTCS